MSAGSQGSLGRNALLGLAFHQVDLALSKRIRFGGELGLCGFPAELSYVNRIDRIVPLGSAGGDSYW